MQHHFKSKERFDVHREFECAGVVSNLPQEGKNQIKFTNCKNMLKVLFAIYADFECVLVNEDDSNSNSVYAHPLYVHYFGRDCSFSTIDQHCSTGAITCFLFLL